MIFNTQVTALAVFLSLAALHCNNASTVQTFTGSHRDTLTLQHTISSQSWEITYPGTGKCTRTLLDFKQSDGFAVYSESGPACFNANTYGKAYFTNDSGGALWYCSYIVGKASTADVKAVTTAADATTPATAGCNGKAWIKMLSADANFALVGSYTDNWSSSHTFSNALWSTSGCSNAIIFYDNTNGFFLYQQQAEAGCYAANNYRFGKVFWAVDSASKLYYCQLFYDKQSYLDVANSTTKPTYTNPSASGCSGFSWTQLIR